MPCLFKVEGSPHRKVSEASHFQWHQWIGTPDEYLLNIWQLLDRLKFSIGMNDLGPLFAFSFRLLVENFQ